MTRVFLPHFFQVKSAIVSWAVQNARLGSPVPVLTSTHKSVLQLRWLLHAQFGILGDPFHVFRLDRKKVPPGTQAPDVPLDHPAWEEIERVGLPVDPSWAGTRYDLGPQGTLTGLVDPVNAAFARLDLGAPQVGWARLKVGTEQLPDWVRPREDDYLKEMLRSPLLEAVKQMLIAKSDPQDHVGFEVKDSETAANPRLQPRGLAIQGEASAPPQVDLAKPSAAAWHPLGALLAAVACDPLASLALGFGTALTEFGDYFIMVTAQVQVAGLPLGLRMELAHVIDPNPTKTKAPPAPPAEVTATRTHGTRPYTLDGPRAEAVAVSWKRMPRETDTAPPPAEETVCACALGRLGPAAGGNEILLTPRPGAAPPPASGWKPFGVGRENRTSAPVVFHDHLSRVVLKGGRLIPDPLARGSIYAVAAQDIFGRYGAWSSANCAHPQELAGAPEIYSVEVPETGVAEVIFSWDWSDRSPQFMEFRGRFEDTPGGPDVFIERADFNGLATPSSAAVDALTSALLVEIPGGLKRLSVTSSGTAQDIAGRPAELRFYRLRVPLTLSFPPGQLSRTLAVSGRGQCHVHETFHPGTGLLVSAFGPEKKTAILDRTQPPPPHVKDAPQWASLPDSAGISRAKVEWNAAPGAVGYIIYEATETTLLAALGRPRSDNAQPFPDRLDPLRHPPVAFPRNEFRRVNAELIAPPRPTSFEVALPRGSTVMHFFAVTAVSGNQQESEWPADSAGFLAFAVPRLAVPTAPTLRATASAGGAAVDLAITIPEGPAAAEVEIYRRASEEPPATLDEMGPPIETLTIVRPSVTGATVSFHDPGVTPGWRRQWYRAVAWSADDLELGLYAARSAPSSPIPIMLPPAAPDLRDLRVNEAGSNETESLVSWASSAPLGLTRLGIHTAAVVFRDPSQSRQAEAALDPLLLPALASASLVPADGLIHRVLTTGAVPYRFYVRVPRFSRDDPMNVRATMIDPKSHRTSLEATVLPPPRLGPAVRTRVFPGPGPFERVMVQWQILTPIPPSQLPNYHVRITPTGPAVTLDQATEVPTAAITRPQVLPLTGRLGKVRLTQDYFVLLHPGAPPLIIISLVDPQGQVVTVRT